MATIGVTTGPCDLALVDECATSLTTALLHPDDILVVLMYDGVWVEPAPLLVPAGRVVVVQAAPGASVSVSTSLGDSVFTVTGGGLLGLIDISAVKVGGRVFQTTGAQSQLVVTGGVFFSLGVSETGAVLLANGGRVQLDGVRFVDSTSVGDGGMVAINGADLVASNSVFRGGFARDGGAVWVGPGSTASFQGCDFADNEAIGAGGALAITGDAVVDVADSTFSANSALDGGAVALTSAAGSLDLARTGLVENRASGRGGGLWVDAGSAVVTASSFVHNVAELQGGGVATLGAVRLTDSFLCENTATEGGGGAWIGGTASAQWLHDRFVENDARQGGGIQVVDDADLEVRQSSFLGNDATIGAAIDTSPAEPRGALRSDANLFGWSTGHVAVQVAFDDRRAKDTRSAYWQNAEGDVGGGGPRLEPALTVDPLMLGYSPGAGCDNVDDRYLLRSPLVDFVGDLRDPDGSAADVGAYGGYGLGGADGIEVWSDGDGDGSPLLYDCNDAIRSIHPTRPGEAENDTPYDGLDQDCDGWSDDDDDEDGYDRGEDCDDTDPDRHPAAQDAPGLDLDCIDGVDLDGDGFPETEDCDDTDATIHPTATEDADPIDRDCDGFGDPPGTLRVLTCSTTPLGLGSWGFVGVLCWMRRRRDG
jgi:hypothetical protein